MQGAVGDIFKDGVGTVKNVIISIDQALAEIRPWKLIVVTAASVIAFQRVRRIWRASERPIHTRLVYTWS